MDALSRNQPLFRPTPIPVKDHLILVPYFYDHSMLAELRRCAISHRRRFGGEWLQTEEFTLITGFLGYPALFTHLAYVAEFFPQRISLLGTAGSLNPELSTTRLLQVTRIMGSGLLRRFSRSPVLNMGGPLLTGISPVTGVSVDMLQRETPAWLQRQRSRGADIVEMELFPLRARLKRDITAVVVLTDSVTERGIHAFRQRDALLREFRRGWLAVTERSTPCRRAND